MEKWNWKLLDDPWPKIAFKWANWWSKHHIKSTKTQTLMINLMKNNTNNKDLHFFEHWLIHHEKPSHPRITCLKTRYLQTKKWLSNRVELRISSVLLSLFDFFLVKKICFEIYIETINAVFLYQSPLLLRYATLTSIGKSFFRFLFCPPNRQTFGPKKC